jgi:hypothetical protein
VLHCPLLEIHKHFYTRSIGGSFPLLYLFPLTFIHIFFLIGNKQNSIKKRKTPPKKKKNNKKFTPKKKTKKKKKKKKEHPKNPKEEILHQTPNFWPLTRLEPTLLASKLIEHSRFLTSLFPFYNYVYV